MSNLPLGEIITTEQHRDAIHVAVAPVEAAHNLSPGARVQLNHEGRAATGSSPVGIVDPFLREPVSKGEKFWLFLFPGTVTSLRHEWEHPAFTQKKSEEPVAPSMSASEAWLREYVKDVCPYDHDGVNDGYEKFLRNARHGEIYYHGSDLHGAGELEKPDELFKHLSVILGKPVSVESFEYSCSC